MTSKLRVASLHQLSPLNVYIFSTSAYIYVHTLTLIRKSLCFNRLIISTRKPPPSYDACPAWASPVGRLITCLSFSITEILSPLPLFLSSPPHLTEAASKAAGVCTETPEAMLGRAPMQDPATPSFRRCRRRLRRRVALAAGTARQWLGCCLAYTSCSMGQATTTSDFPAFQVPIAPRPRQACKIKLPQNQRRRSLHRSSGGVIATA